MPTPKTKTNPLFRIGLCLALASTLFTACKPDSTPDPTPTPGISGILATSRVSGELFGNPLDSSWDSYAQFYSAPDSFHSPVLVGGVSVNGQPMEIDGDSIGYLQSGVLDLSAKTSWVVTGGNGIPSFSYDHNGPHPAYVATLPDTIDRSAGYTLVLNSTTAPNADSVHFELMQLTTDSIGKYGSVSQGNIYFSPAELSRFTAGDEAFLSFTLDKGTFETLGGKNFYFVRERRYIKSMYFR
jgi:hypothetical protein